jgi:hypothetical protein
MAAKETEHESAIWTENEIESQTAIANGKSESVSVNCETENEKPEIATAITENATAQATNVMPNVSNQRLVSKLTVRVYHSPFNPSSLPVVIIYVSSYFYRPL